jgi:hypothetical protein
MGLINRNKLRAETDTDNGDVDLILGHGMLRLNVNAMVCCWCSM